MPCRALLYVPRGVNLDFNLWRHTERISFFMVGVDFHSCSGMAARALDETDSARKFTIRGTYTAGTPPYRTPGLHTGGKHKQKNLGRW